MKFENLHKTIIIGLDGGCFDIFKPWIDEGELPNIKKIICGGVSGELESCIPPNTCPAWKCISTGKNPGKLGVFWWRQINRTNKKVVGYRPDLFKSKEFWDYLGEAGYKVGIIGMPLTEHPKKVNGFMVSGGPYAQEEKYTFPPTLQRELKSRFDYRLHPISNILRQTRDTQEAEEVVEDILKLINMRFDVAKYLLDEENLDFLNVNTFYLNTLQHLYWREDPVKRAWKVVDKKIGEIIKNDYTVIIISDHGMTAVKKAFYINSWLKMENYLKVKTRSKNYTLDKTDLLKKGLNVLDKTGLKTLVKLAIPDKLLERIPIGTESRGVRDASEFEEFMDWKFSKAIGTPGGPIYLLNSENIQEYEKLREELTNKLIALKDPENGKKIIKKVYKKENAYTGQYFTDAPDLIIEPMPEYRVREGKIIDKSFCSLEPDWEANNYPYGIFIAYGPDIKNGTGIKNAKIVDLAPTILYMMKVAIPEDMDGKVLKEIFKDDSEIAKREVTYQKVEGERGRIKQQLKRLKDDKKI